MSIVACLKWVSHPGEPHDERFAGMSPADQSALEFALQQAALLGTGVTAITVGPSGADKVLRDALASPAARAANMTIGYNLHAHTASPSPLCLPLRDGGLFCVM